MDNKPKNSVSVVLRLKQFDELNGELDKFQSEEGRQKFVKNFFEQRFGHGAGRLSIAQKTDKVKLTWLPEKVEPEAEKLHQEALAKAKNKAFKEAVNLWVKAISFNSANPDYYFNLGIAFFEIKNYKESIENLNIAVQLCPIYYKAHLILGTVHLKVRQFEKAEEHLKQSIVFLPNHALAYLNLGAVYSILKRYDEGIRMFERTIEISPREVRAHFGLGKIYAIKGDTRKANQYFRNVIEYDENGKLTTHAQRAMISSPLESEPSPTATPAPEGSSDNVNTEKLYQEGYKAFLFTDYERSAKMYETYVQHKPNDDFVTFSLAEALLRSGHTLKAVEAYQKAIKIDPNKALYHKGLAIAFSYLEKFQEVIECATKAQQLGKNDSILCGLIGKAYLQEGKIDSAIESLEQGLEMNENDLQVKFNLALALMKKNETDAAINYLQEIVRAPVDSPLKMEAEKVLSKTPA